MMEKLLLRIYDFFAGGRRYLAFLIPVVLLGVFYLGIRKIDLDNDIAAFLPYGSGNSGLQSQFVYKNLRSQDKVIALLRLREVPADRFEAVDLLSRAADEFSYRLEEAKIPGMKDLMTGVDAQGALDAASFIAENMPYFLDSKDYKTIDSVLAAGDFMSALQGCRTALISSGGMLGRVIGADPLHFSGRLTEELSALGKESGYNVIGDYLFTSDSLAVMMNFASEYGGSETSGNKQMLSAVYSIRDSVEDVCPEVRIDFTGSPVIAVKNADRMQKDTVICASVALCLIVILLAWYFRRLRPIVLICVPVIFGIASGLAFMGAFQGRISAIALAACSVIFGIAVDYSLLYSTRLGFVKDARSTLRDIASPMVIGNITTVGAFLSLLVMSSGGMRDFGLFAAVALVGAILFVILFLPHWVGAAQYKARDGGWMGRWASFRPEEHRYVFWILVAVTVVLLFFSRKVTFSGDFTKINYMEPAQQQMLDQLSMSSSTGGNIAVYAVAEGRTLDEALAAKEKNAGFTASCVSEGKALMLRGTGSLLPSSAMQAHRLALWKDFASEHGAEILEKLAAAAPLAGFNASAFESFRRLLNGNFQVQPQTFFAPVESLLSPFILRDSTGWMVMDILYVPRDETQALYEDYRNYVEKADGSFLFDSYSLTNNMIDILQDDFNKVLAICSVLVFVFLWIAFRRLELALTAFLPMAVSWIWITGIMGLFGISFNIVNIILATFIFGLGDDYTIFMVEGLQYEYTFRKPLLNSYKTGVTLSATTMFIGIGSMVFAVHPALHSLGAVAVIGMVCVVALAFVLPPVLFRFLTCKSLRKERQDRIFPVKITDILVTVFCGAVLFLVVMYLKIWVLCRPGVSAQAVRMKICRTMRFFCLSLPRVKFNLLLGNKAFSGRKAFETAEKFFDSHPSSVIISNHQSHLDLMCLLALSPSIIVLTNRWTQKTPVYGGIIRKAGYLCTDDGIDANGEFFRRIKDKDCSLLVFPEGTRSADCTVLKFKSGAFAICASQQADLIPVVLFGPGEILPKGEHIIRRGRTVVEIKDIVSCSSLPDFGPRPLKQAQTMHHLYEDWYGNLKLLVYAYNGFSHKRKKDKDLYKAENEIV